MFSRPILIIISLLGVVPLSCVFIWLWMRPKRDAIETHETNTRILTCIVYMILFFALLAIGGVGILRLLFSESSWKALAAVPLAAMLFFPLFYALVSYIRLPKTLKVYYEVESPADTHLETRTAYAAKLLGLKRLPEVWLSACQKLYTPPTVFGRWGTTPILVLPKDFDKAITDATLGKEELVEVLRSFVISHELAHVKNGDYQFMSWITALSRATKYWAWAFITMVCIYSVFLGPKVMMLISIFLWPLLVLFVFFWITYRSISYHREYLADACATSCMPTKDVKKLFNRTSDSISPIEHLFVYFGMRRQLARIQPAKAHSSVLAWMIKQASHIVKRSLDIFGSSSLSFGHLAKTITASLRTHPSFLQRNRAINEKQFLGEIKPHLSMKSSLLAFVATGFAYFIVFFIVVMALKTRNSPLTTMAMVIVNIDAALFLAVILCLPRRNMATSVSGIRTLLGGYMSRCLLGTFVQFAVLSSVLIVPLSFSASKPLWQSLALVGGLCIFFGFATCILAFLITIVIHFSTVWHEIRPWQPKENLMYMLIGFIILLPTMLIGYFIFLHPLRVEMLSHYSILWALLGFAWAFIPAMVTVFLAGKYIVRPYSDAPPSELIKQSVLLGIVALLTLVILGYPSAQIASLIDHKLFVHSQAIQDILLITSLVVTVGIILLLYLTLLGYWGRSFVPLGQLVILSKALAVQPLDQLFDLLKQNLRRQYKTTGGYAYAPRAPADLEITRHAVRALSVTTLDKTETSRTIDWVSSHGVDNSAYARHPGSLPSIGATFAALDSRNNFLDC